MILNLYRTALPVIALKILANEEVIITVRSISVNYCLAIYGSFTTAHLCKQLKRR